MGTFHDNMGPLHGMTVVVDTEGPRVMVGRCHQITETRVILHDADVHDESDGVVSKAEFLKRTAKVGPWARHAQLAVPLDEVASIQLLGELVGE